MNKKLLVSVLLCFFVFSSGMLAKEKAKAPTIEFLDRIAVYNPDPALWKLDIPDDLFAITEFISDTVISLHVPASPGSDALFFELSAQFWYGWDTHLWRQAYGSIYQEIKSNIIPPGIDVYAATNVIDIGETNYAENETKVRERGRQSSKYMMKRDSNGDWFAGQFRVFDTESEEIVDDEIAIPIINSLIDNGFDIEIYTKGYVWGIDWIKLVFISIEVTRLSKN